MKTWIDDINAKAQQEAALRQVAYNEAQSEKATTFERRHTPMRVRLTAIINAMPDDEKGKPRPLEFFVRALAPKYHGNRAHCGETADGLRLLGWTRKRCWHRQCDGFRALWHPPKGVGS